MVMKPARQGAYLIKQRPTMQPMLRLCGHGDSWTNYHPNRRSSSVTCCEYKYALMTVWITYKLCFLPTVESSSQLPYRDKLLTTEKLKELILSSNTTVPVSLAQVTACGLPQPNPDLPFDLPMLVQKFIGDQLGKNPREASRIYFHGSCCFQDKEKCLALGTLQQTKWLPSLLCVGFGA